jgi:hypothetical protein
MFISIILLWILIKMSAPIYLYVLLFLHFCWVTLIFSINVGKAMK